MKPDAAPVPSKRKYRADSTVYRLEIKRKKCYNKQRIRRIRIRRKRPSGRTLFRPLRALNSHFLIFFRSSRRLFRHRVCASHCRSLPAPCCGTGVRRTAAVTVVAAVATVTIQNGSLPGRGRMVNHDRQRYFSKKIPSGSNMLRRIPTCLRSFAVSKGRGADQRPVLPRAGIRHRRPARRDRRGDNRMNIYRPQGHAGLADYLRARYPSSSVAISFDSRIKSDLFARRRPCAGRQRDSGSHLPSTGADADAFLRRAGLHCQSGIMVTASHNPSQYNGYKCYGADGCQMTDHDANEVTACIRRSGYFQRRARRRLREAKAAGLIRKFRILWCAVFWIGWKDSRSAPAFAARRRSA